MTDKDSHDQDATFAETARQRAIEAYDSARDGVADAGRKATGTLKEAPLIALAGVAAAGALIATLLPRTRVETEALRPTVRRVRRTAKAAIDAARETGSDRLNELGITRNKGEETIRSLVEGVTDAAKASGQAALDAAKNQR